MYVSLRASAVSRLFFFNDTATTEIYTLSLHDALPILKSDLRNLATAEEAFFYDSTKYTTNFALMNNFNPSAGVTMTINATTSGWSASTTSAFAPGRQCALFSGTAAPLAPATVEGRITCQ